MTDQAALHVYAAEAEAENEAEIETEAKAESEAQVEPAVCQCIGDKVISLMQLFPRWLSFHKLPGFPYEQINNSQLTSNDVWGF